MANTIKEFSKELLAKTLKEYDTQKVRPIDARIDNIINNPGDGSTPTEVIDARKDIAGTVHPTLGKRIDAEMANVNSLFSTIEGSNISTDTLDGYLKNVEIKGNTIQNEADLADIKSVGDKVEGQELYKIPLLCTGKNLINFGDFEKGSIDNNGNLEVNDSRCRTKSFIAVKPSTRYVTSKNNTQWLSVFEYDKDGVFIVQSVNATSMCSTFTSRMNTKFIKIKTNDDLTIASTNNLQLEEGTQATSFEKYQEHKLTILSPVQIEKVGDVADRIVEKDGVWGVEKNIDSITLNGSEVWTIQNGATPLAGTKYFELKSVQGKYQIPSSNAISNHLISTYAVKSPNDLWNASVNEGISYNRNGYLTIRCMSQNEIELKSWLSNSNILVKLPLVTPQFIPLPHAQQVKLRTFANKTNISFLTEIEGTIKADVPKSLGATVNTHTTQIDNLNNELDRVKKLEQSTVSTVVTDKDFTVVEQTTQGYFEDVELKGRTLVNGYTDRISNAIGNSEISLSTDFITITNPTAYRFARYSHNFDFEIGKSYTIIFNVIENNHPNVGLFIETADGGNVNSNEYKDFKVGLNVAKLVPNKENSSKLRFACQNANTNSVTKISRKIVILEGDHTQNPPSYFEGLKSVGEGTDEIVVSSVDDKYEHTITTTQNKIDYRFSNQFKKGTVFKGLAEKKITLGVRNAGSTSWLKDVQLSKNQEYIVEDNMEVYTLALLSIDGWDTKTVSKKLFELVECSEIETDKKKLLYFDPTDNTWKKPTLREWDSVEKHADGKYWKHKRSEKVVFDGSGDWQIGNDTGNCIHFNTTNPITNIKISGLTISDKFNYSSSFSPDIECVNITGSGRIVIKILKSKLTTQDVAGFKQWLQANPTTVVYQLAKEEVYECTNIDLITYENETNFTVKSGVLSPHTTLKVHSNISNVVSLLQKKVSLLEQNIGSYMITQNRLMLTSRYNADTIGFEYSVSRMASTSLEYDEDLFMLLLENIRIGKNNYDREKMESIIDFYVMYFVISCEMAYILFDIIEEQHNIQEGNIDELY